MNVFNEAKTHLTVVRNINKRIDKRLSKLEEERARKLLDAEKALSPAAARLLRAMQETSGETTDCTGTGYPDAGVASEQELSPLPTPPAPSGPENGGAISPRLLEPLPAHAPGSIIETQDRQRKAR